MSGASGNGGTSLATSGDITSPAVSRDVGEAMAFQVVAQATSSSVIDASDYLRSVAMISTAAIGTMTASMIQQITMGGGPNSPQKWQDGITQIQQNLQDASAVFKQIGTDAADVLTKWKNL